jgi:hypothetical protein
MKKYLFLFIVFFLVNNIHAQINIGIMAGSGFSNRINKNIPDLGTIIIPASYETFTSFYLGGYIDFSLSENFLLSPELFYARRGWKFGNDLLQTTITSINNDLILPVLIKFCFLKRFQVYTGPEFSYVISRDSKGVTLSSSSESKYERSYDIAFSAGGSVRVIKNLYIDLRYTRGLIDQSKTYYIPGEFIDPGLAGQQIPVDYEAYNWSFQIGLKYNIFGKN